MKKILSIENHHQIGAPQLGDDDRQSTNNNHVSPNEFVRDEWKTAAKEAHKNRDDKLMLDFPNKFDQDKWEW